MTKIDPADKQEKAPQLYSLTALQRDANRFLGFTAQQTLDYTQSLYEKKLVTYPRTDSRFLTEDMESMIPDLAGKMAAKFGYTRKMVIHPKQVINNSKVSDHHAIIPSPISSNDHITHTKTISLQDNYRLKFIFIAGKHHITAIFILNPLIVRPKKDGCYEIISGHRRKSAAEKIGYRKVPVIIRVLKDDEAVVLMIDSNLQREMISPSEKAFVYKMKYEAIKRKAGRRKCGQVDHNLGKKSIELIGEECGDSPKQVQRYIKITDLIPEMLEKVDDGLSEIKQKEIDRVVFKTEQLHRFFLVTYTAEQMRREILEMLKLNMKKYWDA